MATYEIMMVVILYMSAPLMSCRNELWDRQHHLKGICPSRHNITIPIAVGHICRNMVTNSPKLNAFKRTPQTPNWGMADSLFNKHEHLYSSIKRCGNFLNFS